MKKTLNRLIRKTPLARVLKKRQAEREIEKWKNDGKPVPPPHIIKQRALVSYAEKFGLKIMIETGTFYGDMVDATKENFEQIYSIELSEELFERARVRFKGDGHIKLIHGDSGVELKKLMNNINQPALFWLDGHYSAGVTARGDKDTPINEELSHILSANDLGHVIIIDDARCFGVDPAYPSIEELTSFVRGKRLNIDIAVQDDSIRITPKR